MARYMHICICVYACIACMCIRVLPASFTAQSFASQCSCPLIGYYKLLYIPIHILICAYKCVCSYVVAYYSIFRIAIAFISVMFVSHVTLSFLSFICVFHYSFIWHAYVCVCMCLFVYLCI